MKIDSVKGKVINYFRNLHYGGKDEIPAGIVEDYLREITGSKGSTTDRRMRELADVGVLIKVQEQPYKKYKLNPDYL